MKVAEIMRAWAVAQLVECCLANMKLWVQSSIGYNEIKSQLFF